MKKGKKYLEKLTENRKLWSVLMAASLIILSLATCISASRVYELAFNNTFTTGSVDIDLKQMQIDETGARQEAGPKAVLPGERVSYMPEVTNLRADAYVRVKIDIEMDEYTERPITTDDIFSITDGWIQKGEWFYNTSVMKKGDTSIAFLGLEVPGNWVKDPENDLPAVPENTTPAKASDFTIKTHADAIQAENFRPDFDSDMPWGAVVTETAKDVDNTSYDIATPHVIHNEMTFNGTGGLQANTKDLFRDFQYYMAGDAYIDSLKIKNNASHDITVYFKTKCKSTDLNEKMKLKIEIDGDNVYSGDMVSEDLDKYEKLTVIEPYKTAKLNYSVTLPEDSKNYYSVLEDEVEWDFKVVEDTHTPTTKTGDSQKFLIWLFAFGISLILLTLLVNGESARLLREKENSLKSDV